MGRTGALAGIGGDYDDEGINIDDLVVITLVSNALTFLVSKKCGHTSSIVQ